MARSALTAGAADYVTKPFTFQYLDAVLDIHLPSESLDRRRAVEGAASASTGSSTTPSLPLDPA